MKIAQQEVSDILRGIIGNDNKFVYGKQYIRWGSVEIELNDVLHRFRKRLIEDAPKPEKENLALRA